MLSIILRTIFYYLFIVLIYRIMGKREVGQLGVTDLTVSILIAELVAMSIENYTDSIFLTVVPLIFLVSLELISAYLSMKSKKIRVVLDGKPSLIICSGKINYKEMIKQKYNLDDLLLSVRQKEIKSLDEIEFAFLEKNGKLSIFKYNKEKKKTNYPMPLILDGDIQKDTLSKISKNTRWLEQELKNNEVALKEVFYAFYKGKELFIIKK